MTFTKKKAAVILQLRTASIAVVLENCKEINKREKTNTFVIYNRQKTAHKLHANKEIILKSNLCFFSAVFSGTSSLLVFSIVCLFELVFRSSNRYHLLIWWQFVFFCSIFSPLKESVCCLLSMFDIFFGCKDFAHLFDFRVVSSNHIQIILVAVLVI